MKELEVKVGNSTVVVPAIVLEGLHFDVLIGMSWLKAAEAIIDVVNGSIRIQGEQIPYKAWPEPASFLTEDGVKLYFKELAVISKGEPKMIEVYHQQLDQGEVMYLQFNERAKVTGNFLAETNQEGLVGAIEVEGREDANNVIQKGQCLGWLFPLLNVKINKVFNSYFVFCLLDFSVGLNHLNKSAFNEFLKLLLEWSFIFSKKK